MLATQKNTLKPKLNPLKFQIDEKENKKPKIGQSLKKESYGFTSKTKVDNSMSL